MTEGEKRAKEDRVVSACIRGFDLASIFLQHRENLSPASATECRQRRYTTMGPCKREEKARHAGPEELN